VSAALIACAVFTGCGPPPRNDFTAVFVDSTRNCNAQTTNEMDSYVVQIIDVEPQFMTGAGTFADCERCLIEPGACVIEHQQVCACSGHVEATSDTLSNTLYGVQFGGLDTTDVYCMRVIALDTGRSGTGPATTCPCQTSYTDGTYPVAMCAIGNPLSLGALQMRMDINLDVHCPTDGTATGGTPATGVATFSGCYPPPVPAGN
jgi:hypothetical protein